MGKGGALLLLLLLLLLPAADILSVELSVSRRGRDRRKIFAQWSVDLGVLASRSGSFGMYYSYVSSTRERMKLPLARLF